MVRRGAIFAFMLALTSLAHAQESIPTHFDAIVVKPSRADSKRMSLQWSSTGWETQNLPLRVLIAFASNVQPWLVSGLPRWAENTRWDMTAKVVDANAKPLESLSGEQRRALMISVLQDRFGMVSHREKKLQPVFVMTVLPGGPKFQRTQPQPAGVAEPKFGRTHWTLEGGILQGYAITMPLLGEQLSGSVDRNVIDQTGLNGQFDVRLQLPVRESSNPADDGGEAGPPQSLFEALKEQLGLKLSSDKAPVPAVVVEKLTQPEEN